MLRDTYNDTNLPRTALCVKTPNSVKHGALLVMFAERIVCFSARYLVLKFYILL